MIFSHSCQYAIKSCIYLARNHKKIGVGEIAEFINSPIPFTSKILQKLAKSNAISSVKGRNGGFYLSDEQYHKLTVKEVCEIFGDEKQLLGCVLGLSECSGGHPCPIHHINEGIKEKLQLILDSKIKELKGIGNIHAA